MPEEKQFKIDIPQSLDNYKITLFWGLGLRQIILVFGATLFMGFGIFNLAARHFILMPVMFVFAGLLLLGIIEIRGRNFYKHIMFILSYYKNKPKVLVYNHYSSSGLIGTREKQLVYQKDNHKKIFFVIFIAIFLGILLLILTGIYIYHVIHK